MFRNLGKLYKQLNLIICFQMIFAPLALARDGRDDLSSARDNDFSFWGDVAYTAASAINQFSGAYTQGIGQNNNSYQNHYNNLNGILGLQPMQPGTGQFPAVFDGCMVLPARGNQLGTNAKCTSASHDEVLSGYAQAMIDVADENINKLENFTTQGANRTDARGVTCYNEAISGLANQLKQREEQLRVYEQRLQGIFDKFELDSKETLAKIKQNDQILNGPCSGCKEKNGSKPVNYLEDYRFDKELLGAQDRGICGSWLSQSKINGDGRKAFAAGSPGGFKGIRDNFIAQEAEADKFNGKKKEIKKEIETVSRLLAGRYAKRDGLLMNSGVTSISTRLNHLNMNSGAMGDAIKRIGTQISDRIQDIESSSAIATKVAGDPQADLLFKEIKAADQGGANLTEQQLGNKIRLYERQTQGACLNGLMASNFGSDDPLKVLRRFKNPNISRRKASDADNALANTLAADMGNLDNMSLDSFLEKVKKEEAKGMNSRKILTLGRTFNFDGRTINASTPLRPSQLFGIFIKNCKDRYERERTSSGYSQKDMLDAIKNYASKRKQLKQEFSGIIQRDLRNELLNCTGDTTTGVGAVSCDNSSLNPGSAKFCYRTAQKCASNVSACKSRIDSKVKQIEAEQQKDIDLYKGQVEQAKNALLAEVSAVQGFMVNEAKRLDALMNVGTLTELPELAINLTGQNVNRKDVRAELALEDPEQYLQMVKGQISNLSDSLKAQRVALVGEQGEDPTGSLGGKGRLGRMAAQYQQNYQSAKSQYQQIVADCEGAIRNAQEVERKRAEDLQNTNQEIASACSQLAALSADPFSGDIGQVANDAARAVQLAASMPNQGRFINSRADMRVIDNIRSLNSSCSEESNRRFGSSRNGAISPRSFCEMITEEGASRPNSSGTKQDAWDTIIGENNSPNTNLKETCQSAGYAHNNAGGSGNNAGPRSCTSNDSNYIKSPYKVCKLSGLIEGLGSDFGTVEYVELSGGLPNARISLSAAQSTGWIHRGNCPANTSNNIKAFNTANTSGRDGKAELRSSSGSRTMAENSYNDIDGNLLSQVFTCNPNSSSETTPREDAREEIDNLIAGFSCINGSRRAGQQGLTICGGDMNGTSDKAIYGQMANDLAGAMGQAMAAGR